MSDPICLSTLTYRGAIDRSSDQLAVVKLLCEHGVLHQNSNCIYCEVDMDIDKYSNLDGCIWRCHKCWRRITVRRDSYFSRSKISIGNCFLIIFCHLTKPKMTYQDIADLCEIDRVSVGEWCRFIRESISHYFVVNPLILGHLYPIQIDESLFGGKMKYHLGDHHTHKKSWVFGIVEEQSQRCVFWCVNNRVRQTLFNLICLHAAPGCIIKSDQWAAYATLNQEGFDHRTVNHSRNFVAEDGTNTQMIEGAWSQLKTRISARRGTRQEDLPGYLDLLSFEKEARFANVQIVEFFFRIIKVRAFY